MNLSRFDRKTPEQVPNSHEKTVANGIVKKETTDDVSTVYLSGKIDATNFEEIQKDVFEIMEKKESGHFVFDMNEVNYVSSAGLRMFSAVNHKAAEVGMTYKLSKMREDIMKLFQMTGYASAFSIELREE